MAALVTDIRVRWIVADPAREHAVDPLGMGAQADALSALLVPQLSGRTFRARYLSFLSWAVKKSHGRTSAIHRLEAKLTLDEARLHRDAPRQCPAIVGIQKADEYLRGHAWKAPARPERLYKSTAFAAYRATMRMLGLLDQASNPGLTEQGEDLALAFSRKNGRESRCLSEISTPEKRLIKSLLGLDYRCPPSSLTEHQESRRNTFEHLWRTLSNGSIAVLEDHLEVGSRPSTVARLLHKASVWELLSLGLGLSFSMLLAEGHVGPVARKLREALNRRPRRPALGELAANSDESAFQVVGLLRAAAQLRPVELGLDPGPSELSSILLQGRDAERFLSSLVDRHRVAKSDAPWIELVEQRVRKLAPTKAISLPIRPRAYRLDAYGQILRDLGMIT